MLAEKQIQKDLDTLQSGLQRLVGDFQEMAKVEPIGGKPSEHQEAFVHKSAERLQEMINQAQVTLNRAKDRLQETGQQAKHTVEEHPVASLLTALGVGVLLGKLWNRGGH